MVLDIVILLGSLALFYTEGAMDNNQQVIDEFYTAFKQRDYKTMQRCYADSATFSDAIFKDLNYRQLKAMWQMLCKNSSDDFKLEYRILSAQGGSVVAQWTAWYTFSATGNKVINRIKANFILHEGKIISHIDDFDFYNWAKQALGVPGMLFGWLPFFKNKVQKKTHANLAVFINKNNL